MLHKLLGHPCEEITRKTANEFNYELKGKFEVCADCALSKIAKKT